MRLLPARPKKTDERRRRRYGFWLFAAGLIAMFFLVRAVPADWEIGPFRIDANGNAGDPQASLYLADDHRPPSTQAHAPAERLSDRDAFGGPDTHAYSDARPDADAHGYPHADAYPDPNTNAYADTDAYAPTDPHPNASAYAPPDA